MSWLKLASFDWLHRRLSESPPLGPALALAAALAATLSFWVLLPPDFKSNESSDFTSYYDPVARNLVAGHGLITNSGKFGIFYPPGYPLMLAAIYGIAAKLGIAETLLLSLFMLLCIGVTVVAIYQLSSLFGHLGAALVAALLWATYPFALWLNKQPNSELPFMAFFFSGYFLLWRAVLAQKTRWRSCYSAGLLIGVAMLIRPIAIFAWVLLAIMVWLTAHEMRAVARLRIIAFFLAGVFTLVMPWEMVAYARTGKFILLSDNGGFAMRGGLVFAAAKKDYRQPVSVPDDVRALMQDTLARYDELNSTGSIATYLGAELQKRPIAVLKLVALKALRSWYATDSQRYEKQILLLQIPYLILIVLGSLRAWKHGNTSRWLMATTWLLVIYFWGMSILVTSTLRYMVPAMGLLMTLLAGLFPAPKLQAQPLSPKPFAKPLPQHAK